MKQQNSEQLKVDGITKAMRTLDAVMTKIEDVITVTFMIVMTVALLAGVVMRFILKIPNQYGEEISRYSMIIVAFVGISIGVRQKAHLGVEGVVNSLPAKISRIVRIIASLVTTFGYGLISYEAFAFVAYSKKMNQVSPAMRLPMWTVYCVLLVGFTMSFIRSIMVFWNDYLAKDSGGLLEIDEDIDQNFQ